MSSKRAKKSKESNDENSIKQIIKMNLQLSNRCNQKYECAKKYKQKKNLKMHLEKLESERYRNDFVIFDLSVIACA